jgi:hypothetical protein
MSGMLNRKSLVLAKIETTAGVDAVPTQALDAILVMNPQYSADPKLLPRKFVTPTLSPNAQLVGRKLAKLKFECEVRGNGKQQSGVLTDAPMLTRLMNACGYGLTAISGVTSQIFPVVPDVDNPATSPVVTWADGAAAPTLVTPVVYTITCTTGGSSGTAAVRVTSNNTAEDNPSATPVTITSGTALALGTKGSTVVPTFTGSLTVGQKWRVLVSPKGTLAQPNSASTATMTLYFYTDGLLWKLTNAQGTWSLKAPAGELPVITFEFTGQYNAPTDTALPTSPVFETTMPSQVELAQLTWGSNSSLVVSEWDFDAGLKLNPRADVNSPDGYNGVRITDRETAGSFKPEAELEGVQAFWADFAAGKVRHFYAKFGSVAGNTVALCGPAVQSLGINPGDKDGVLEYDIKLSFTRGANGDDEIFVLFV